MRQPRAWQRASPFFCGDLLEHRIVEHRLGQKLFELRILVLERLQPLGVRHVKAAVFGLPFVGSAPRTAIPAQPGITDRQTPIVAG
jgi:hypothetical protein